VLLTLHHNATLVAGTSIGPGVSSRASPVTLLSGTELTLVDGDALELNVAVSGQGDFPAVRMELCEKLLPPQVPAFGVGGQILILAALLGSGLLLLVARVARGERG